MRDFGKVKPGTTLYIPFATYDSNDPSGSVTASGFAVGDIKIYKDGNTTERASTSGFTLLDTDGIDFSGDVGIHGFSIDLADNTTADFYQAGSQYWVVVSSIVVDGADPVSFIAATFRIGYEGSFLDTNITVTSQTEFVLDEGPAEAGAIKGCIAVIHDIASAVQFSTVVVQAYAVTSKTVTLAAAPSFTIATGDNISFFLPALTPTTPGTTLKVESSGRVDIDLIEGVDATDQINAACDASIETYKLDHLVAVADSDDPVDNSIVAKLASTTGDWSTHVAGTDSLQAVRDHIGDGTNLTEAGGDGDHLTEAGGTGDQLTAVSLSATGLDAIASTATGMVEIAKAIWDRVLNAANHNVASSAGRRLRQLDAAFEVHSGTAQAGSTATTFKMDTGADGTNDDIYRGDRIVITGGTGAGEHGIITSYTASSRTATMAETWVVTPLSDSEFSVVPADVDVETWNHNVVTGDGDWATLDSNVDTLLTRITSTIFAGITSLADWLGLMAGKQVADATALAEIKATGAGSGTYDESTDSLEARADGEPTNFSSMGIEADGHVHADVKEWLGSAVPSLVSGKIDTNVDRINNNNASAVALAAYYGSIHNATITGGTATTVTLNASAEGTTDDVYKGQIIFIHGGTGNYQARLCTAYTASSKIATVTPAWEINPVSGDSAMIIPWGYIQQANAITDSAISSSTFAAGAIDAASIAADAITNAKIANDAIGATEIADGAIDAATFAAGAIDAAALATDAVDEIADGVWDEDIVAAHNTADTSGAILSNILPEKNAAFPNIEFLFVDSTDHVTPVTSAGTLGATVSIDGGAFGAAGSTPVEVGNGIYQYDATAADMNGDIITFRFTATTGTPNAPDDCFVTIKTSG